MPPFQYELDAQLHLSGSNEYGTVIGRAEYSNKEPQYLLRYRAADGRLVESWWDQDALTAT